MKRTLLLVFIHGFKGSDDTFGPFPKDLRALISNTLPKLNVLSVQYPRYETRGDLKECVARFKEWLQNKVIDLEVENGTPSPTVDPSVHVVLVGHSMGGIVAAETVLSIAKDALVPTPMSAGRNATETAAGAQSSAGSEEKNDGAESASPDVQESALFFPYIDGVLALDTPFLGISPGVLAHGAEEQIKQASTAYKAYEGASQLFGWGNGAKVASQPLANASSRGLPAPAANGTNWGKWAMYGGAAAAIAGAAGAAYLSWNQINQGLTWAGSHLEFVGCLARGAELQDRVEQIVKLTETHGLGFANFYGALGEKVSSKTQYAAAMMGQVRTFCVIPKQSSLADSPTGSKRSTKTAGHTNSKPARKKRKPQNESEMQQEMEEEGEEVREFALDPSKRKGDWVKCVNELAGDELKAHTSMFRANKNPGYFSILPLARDRVVSWVDEGWYARGEEEHVSPAASTSCDVGDFDAEHDEKNEFTTV